MPTIVLQIVSYAFQIYSLLILIRVVFSWLALSPYRASGLHPLVRLLNRVTDPVLLPLQRIIPPIGGAIDISPLVALLLLQVLRYIVLSLLSRL
jgi:YggT family protein